MVSQTRKRALAMVFWIKAYLAMALACLVFAWMMLTVVEMHQQALVKLKEETEGVFDFGDPNKTTPDCALRKPTSSTKQVGRYTRTLSGNNRLEPPADTALWGFSLDWAVDTPQRLVQRLSSKSLLPVYINTFIKLTRNDFEENMINWQANECKKMNAMLEISLMPMDPVDSISDQTLQSFADQMRHVNAYYGVPVMLRFGHEMNGPWMIHYGMRPIEYKNTFRKLATYIYARTNMTAMLWAPNVARGYPYGHSLAQSSPANQRELDTNGDGVLTYQDDPYLPYYPGDQYVDWVGLSMYLYEINTFEQQTMVTPNRYIEGLMNEHAFYERFSNAKAKPMAFGETGAPYFLNATSQPSIAEEVAVKRSWWQHLFDISIVNTDRGLYPNLKMFNYFEELKVETATIAGSQIVMEKDFRITFKPELVNVFVSDINQRPAFKWADQLEYQCNGAVNVV